MFKLVLASLILGGASASAATSNPEYLHQAPLGASELTPFVSYAQYKIKAKNGNSVEQKGFREGVRFEHGLTDQVSAGAFLAGHSLKATSSAPNSDSTTESGLEDLSVFMHGRADMPQGSVRYGVDVNFALEKEKIEANGNSNATSGGISLAPFLGYETNAGQGTAGARLRYKFLVGDRKGEETLSSGTTSSFTTTGGHVLDAAVFYELPVAPMASLGVAYELAFVEKTKIEQNGTKSDRSTSRTVWNLAAYVPVDVTPTIRILPQISYGRFSAFDTTNIDSVELWGIDLGARFTF